MWTKLPLLVALAHLTSVQTASITFTYSDVFAEVDTGGTVRLGRFNRSSTTYSYMDSNAVTLSLQSIAEVTKSGEIVTDENGVSHSFLKGSRQFGLDRTEMTKYENLRGIGRSMRLIYDPMNTKIVAEACLVYTAGQVNYGTTPQHLNKGNAAVRLEIQNWKWCSPCGGKAINLVLKYQATKPIDILKVQGQKTTKISSGGGTGLLIPAEASVDGIWQSMPDDFLNIDTHGSWMLLNIKLPKFTTSLKYDLIVQPGTPGSEFPTYTTTTTKPELHHVHTVTKPSTRSADLFLHKNGGNKPGSGNRGVSGDSNAGSDIKRRGKASVSRGVGWITTVMAAIAVLDGKVHI